MLFKPMLNSPKSFGQLSREKKPLPLQKITSSFTGRFNAHRSFIFNVSDTAIWTRLRMKRLIRSSCSLTKALYKPLGALLLNLELSLPPPAHADSVPAWLLCLEMSVKVSPGWIRYFLMKLGSYVTYFEPS